MVFIKCGVKKCNETVYRTTPATPGLLNLYIYTRMDMVMYIMDLKY